MIIKFFYIDKVKIIRKIAVLGIKVKQEKQ